MYISALGMASNLSEAAASSNDILLLYSTTHESNLMNLDMAFYILPSEAVGSRIQGEEKQIQLLQGGRELQSLIFHENHLFITVRIKLP